MRDEEAAAADEEFVFDSEPSGVISAISALTPSRPTYTEDLRSGDHRLENIVADNILRVIFSNDHRISAKIAIKKELSTFNIPEEQLDAFKKAAYRDSELLTKFNHNPKNMEKFIKSPNGYIKIKSLVKENIKIITNTDEISEELNKFLIETIIAKFEFENTIKKIGQDEVDFDTVAIMIHKGTCFIAANYKNRETNVFGLREDHIPLIRKILEEEDRIFYQEFKITEVFLIKPELLKDHPSGKNKEHIENALPHAEMQCLSALIRNFGMIRKENSQETVLGVSKSCCKECSAALKRHGILKPDRYREHDVYLVKELPDHEKLLSKYIKSYIFINKMPETVKLYYINHEGQPLELKVDKEEFNKISIPEEIDLSKPIRQIFDNSVVNKLWKLIKDQEHAQLRKPNDNPEKNWTRISTIGVDLIPLDSVRRNSSQRIFDSQRNFEQSPATDIDTERSRVFE